LPRKKKGDAALRGENRKRSLSSPPRRRPHRSEEVRRVDIWGVFSIELPGGVLDKPPEGGEEREKSGLGLGGVVLCQKKRVSQSNWGSVQERPKEKGRGGLRAWSQKKDCRLGTMGRDALREKKK